MASILPAQAEPTLTRVSVFEWTHPEEWFGGFSGLEVSTDGTDLTVISDRGRLLQGTINRNAGTIDSVDLYSMRLLYHANGKPLQGRWRDSEGLAIAPTGDTFVSFEYRHRVTRVDLATGQTVPLVTHPDFETFGTNKGLEALAIHPDGRLFALAERIGGQDGRHRLYALDDKGWQIAYRLPAGGSFRPVGADFDKKGRLYLLERTVTPLGFRSRIRQFNFETGIVVTLLTSLPGAYDNLEALSVWTDENGDIRILTLSDDNFLAVQSTQFVEFLLTE